MLKIIKYSILIFFSIYIFLILPACSRQINEKDNEQYFISLKLYNEKKFLEAKEGLIILNYKYPENPEILFLTGKTYFFLNDYINAKKYLNKCIRLKKNSINSLLWLSRILIMENKKDQALKYLIKIKDIDNSNIDGNLLLGKLYYEDGKYNESLQYFSAALENEEMLSEIYFEIGNINLEIDNTKEAIIYLNKAKLLTEDFDLKNKIDNLIKESLK